MRQRVKNMLVKDKPEECAAVDGCHHHWVIEAAHGPTSKGVCKRCGLKKEFSNSVQEYIKVVRRDTNPFDLPEMPDVELDAGHGRQ